MRHLQSHWTTLQVWVSKINQCLCLEALPTESLGYTTLICVQPQVQPMFVCSTYRMTGLHYTYGCATFRITELHYTYRCPRLIDALVWEPYLQNRWVTLHLLVSSLKCILWLLSLLTQSLDHTRIMGASPSALHHTYVWATLRAACVGYLYPMNHWVHYTYWSVTLSLVYCC